MYKPAYQKPGTRGLLKQRDNLIKVLASTSQSKSILPQSISSNYPVIFKKLSNITQACSLLNQLWNHEQIQGIQSCGKYHTNYYISSYNFTNLSLNHGLCFFLSLCDSRFDRVYTVAILRGSLFTYPHSRSFQKIQEMKF